MSIRYTCGRPTKKGTPCSLPPLVGEATCYGHLDLDGRRALRAARDEAIENGIPACHTWDAPLPGQNLFDWQARRCGICDYAHAAVTDHCHRTGLVRGLLCTGCNIREGRGNAPVIVAYRLRPPAVIFGWTIEYDGDWGVSSEPEHWVVDALGPVPDDLHAAARYLEAAARLPEPAMRPEDNPLRKMGL